MPVQLYDHGRGWGVEQYKLPVAEQHLLSPALCQGGDGCAGESGVCEQPVYMRIQSFCIDPNACPDNVRFHAVHQHSTLLRATRIQCYVSTVMRPTIIRSPVAMFPVYMFAPDSLSFVKYVLLSLMVPAKDHQDVSLCKLLWVSERMINICTHHESTQLTLYAPATEYGCHALFATNSHGIEQ